MPTVKYIEANGTEHEVEVPIGTSIMQGAVNNMIEGIVAECGGVCVCATCHCFVDEQWASNIAEANGTEKEMLEFVDDLRTTSRLSCQIEMTEQLDGLVVQLPESQ